MEVTGELVVRDTVQQQPAITPLGLIELAVQKGANVEQLQQLFELKLRVEADEARKAYVVAIGQFKEHAPAILKGKAVSFGNTRYKHATLDDASERIGLALSEHGLSHRWNVEQTEAGIRVTCVLTHVLGHSEQVSMQASPDTSGSKNSIQAIGSAVSYLQRYTLFAATGIAPKDADDDGRQGVKGLTDDVKAGFLRDIAACQDTSAVEELWGRAAAACFAARDQDTHAEIRAAVVAKTRSFAPVKK